MHFHSVRTTRVVKRLVPATISVSIIALVVAGCSSNPAAGTDPSASSGAGGKAALFSSLPADIQKSGTLNVASDVEYPPFESFDTDNTTVVGIDRDLADAIEKQLGVKLKFENVPFDSIIPGLAAKRYDLAMSAMSDTVVRQKQVDFVDYFNAGGAIMLPPNSTHKIKSLDDLCGLKVAVDKGTTEVDDAAAQDKKCQAAGKPVLATSVYPGQNETILALQSGRADAALVDFSTGSYVAKTTGAGITMLPPYQHLAFGIVFPKESALTAVFQKALDAIKADGSYLTILKKYGEELGAIDAFTINGTKD